MNKLAGTTILYNPSEELIKNLKSYSNYLELLIVFDNSTTKQVDLENRIKSISRNILFINNLANFGIAKCLNKAASIALENNCDWLLTMDQDSSFSEDDFSKYCNRLKEANTLFPQLSILTTSQVGNFIGANTKLFSLTRIAITSGSIINLKIWKSLNGFEEKLFIDEVDTDYVFKNLIANYPIVEVADIFLNHQLGTIANSSLLNISVNRRIYPPFRIYFMVRNYFFVKSKYQHQLPNDVAKRRRQLLVTLKNSILFSKNKLETLKSIYKGYIDYKRNRFN